MTCRQDQRPPAPLCTCSLSASPEHPEPSFGAACWGLWCFATLNVVEEMTVPPGPVAGIQLPPISLALLFPDALGCNFISCRSFSFDFGQGPGGCAFYFLLVCAVSWGTRLGGQGPTFPPPSGCCAGEIRPGGSQELGRSPGPRMEAPLPPRCQCVAGTLVRLCSQSREAVARGSGVRAPRGQLEQKHVQGPRAWAVAVPPPVSSQLVCFASVPRSWRLF